MMKGKRLCALLLAAMTLASVTACGGNGAGGSTVSETTSAAASGTETTAEETTASYTETLGQNDFGGAEINVIAQSVPGANPSISSESLTGETVLDALYTRDRDAEDLLNVTINYSKIYTTVDDRGKIATELKKAVLAGDCPWNYAINSIALGLASVASDGIFTDLASVPNLTLESAWWNSNMYENLSYKGKLFFDAGPISLAYYYSPCILAYNQKIAENYGVTDIYDRVLDGSWTIDYYASLTKDIARDIDGDGVMTESDFYGLAVDQLSAQSFFIGIGGRHDQLDSDGAPEFVIGSEVNVTKLEKVASIVGVKDQTLLTEGLKGDSFTEKKTRAFKAGQSFFLGYNMSGLIDQLRDMEDDYGIIPLPKYDETQDRYYTYGSSFGPVGVAIPLTVSGGELAMTGAVMETLAYLSYENVGTQMFNITLKEKVARDDNSKAMLDIIYEDVIYDWTQIFAPGGLSDLTRAICTGEKTDFLSKWASIEEKANSELKKVTDAYDINTDA